MPAILTNANKFRLSTDFPIEKVVYRKTGVVTVTNHPTHSDAQTFTFPHGLGFAPLCRGSYRFTSAGGNVDWLSFDTSTSMLDAFGGTIFWFNGLIIVVYSDDTNVYLYVWNEFPDTLTIEYRIVGFADPIADIETPSTNTFNPDFVFNSDYNYLKIVDQGSGIQPMTPGIVTKTIPHNLGYTPQTFVWSYSPDTLLWGAAGTENYIGATAFGASYTVDSQNLTITFDISDISGDAMYAYRIFADA